LLRCSKYRLSGRDGRDVCQVAIFEEIRTSGYAKGNLHNACSGLPVGVRRGRGWCPVAAWCSTMGMQLRSAAIPHFQRSGFDFLENRCSAQYPKGDHASSEALVPIGVGRSLHKWPPGRPKTGHPADAPTLGTTYSSAPGRGRIPFPIGFASGLPHYWPRRFLIASAGAAFTLSRSYGAGARQAFAPG
jgi:hypothetical protein